MECALCQPFTLGLLGCHSAYGPNRYTTLEVGAEKASWRRSAEIRNRMLPQESARECNCCGVGGELITAHLLLVLSHAQTHKLGELGLYPAQEQHQYPELNSQVSEAISRFTLLTALSLDSLEVEADTLQVSTQ